jgi:REP element-mobilizing transposase RayT
MPRHRRVDISGAIHHVIVRRIERKRIFYDDTDREEFLHRLERALADTGCICYAWCLIPNHFHLLVRTGELSLSEMMRKLLTGYAIYFNRRHKRSGYLYQNRYKSVLCEEETYFLELVRYIHLNPLRAMLVESIKGLEGYPWSGHSALTGQMQRPWQATEEVWIHFGKDKKKAIQGYRDFTVDGIAMGRRDDLTGGGLKRSAGGWEGIKKLKKQKELWRGDERILGNGDFVEKVLQVSEQQLARKEQLKKEGWNLERLAREVCSHFGIKKEMLQRKGRSNDSSSARSVICHYGYRELSVGLKEMARFFGISQPAISKHVVKGGSIIKDRGIKLLS